MLVPAGFSYLPKSAQDRRLVVSRRVLSRKRSATLGLSPPPMPAVKIGLK